MRERLLREGITETVAAAQETHIFDSVPGSNGVGSRIVEPPLTGGRRYEACGSP